MPLKKLTVLYAFCRSYVSNSRIIVLTIFKVFVRPHLDYGDILYDQTFITTLAITGAIRGTSREKLEKLIDKKINQLHIKGYFMTKNSFVAEVTFKESYCSLLDNTDSALTQTLLFGNPSFKSNKNLKILIATIDILSTRRFDDPLLYVDILQLLIFLK